MGEINNYIDILEANNLRVLNRQEIYNLYKDHNGNVKEFICQVAERSDTNVIFMKEVNCCESNILYFLRLEGFTGKQVTRILNNSKEGEDLWLVSQTS